MFFIFIFFLRDVNVDNAVAVSRKAGQILPVLCSTHASVAVGPELHVILTKALTKTHSIIVAKTQLTLHNLRGDSLSDPKAKCGSSSGHGT